MSISYSDSEELFAGDQRKESVILEEHEAPHRADQGQLSVRFTLDFHSWIQGGIRIDTRWIEKSEPHSGVEERLDRLSNCLFREFSLSDGLCYVEIHRGLIPWAILQIGA